MAKTYSELASEYNNDARQNASLSWYHDRLFKTTPNLVFKVAHLFRGEPLTWMARDISFSEIFRADSRISEAALECLEKETEPSIKEEFLKLWEGSSLFTDEEINQFLTHKQHIDDRIRRVLLDDE